LTDGENNAGKIPPNTAAEALKALHIKLYAIGIGTNGNAPYPMFDPRTGNAVTDAIGNVIYRIAPVSFNEAGLKEVAKIADGQFYRATDTKSLETIYRDIDKMERSTVSVKKYQQYRDLFPLCLMSGCGLLIGHILLSQTIWKKLP
jgi:Ca-activated chloride channel family protein